MQRERQWIDRLLEPRTLKRVAWGLLLLGVALMVLWLGRLAVTAWSLQAHLSEVQALIEGEPLAALKADPGHFGVLLKDIRADVVTLRSARGILRLGPALGWLPKVGPVFAQAEPLLDLADALTEAGVLGWDFAQPALQAWKTGALTPELATTLLAGGRAPLEAMQGPVARAQVAYAQLTPSKLPWRLQQPLNRLGPLLPLLENGLSLATVAPELLGASTPRTYLVLALNDDELRPGGGFITAVGEVEVRAGNVGAVTFADSYTVDDFSQPYPLAPEAFRRFMGIEPFVFRDSNWSPDFPSAMTQALELYRPAQAATRAGGVLDGVVAMDQVGVEALVRALGPLEVEGQTVTEASLMTYIHDSWSPPGGIITNEWSLGRKDFMGDLVQALRQRVEGGLGEIDLALAGKTLLETFDGRHIQIALFTQPEAAKVLAARGWDGALRPAQGDFLHVSEANLGYNKASPRIARAMDYAVDLTQSPPIATLTLTYTHTSQVQIACTPETRWDPVYVDMMDRCYWAYLRIYAPPGSQLLSASRHPIPAEAMWDGKLWPGEAQLVPETTAHTVWGQGFLLPTREQTVLRFTYTLPPEALRQDEGDVWLYHLDWQKQAGLRTADARVTLRLPQNVVLCKGSEWLPTQSGALVVAENALQQDWALDIRYCTDKDK